MRLQCTCFSISALTHLLFPVYMQMFGYVDMTTSDFLAAFLLAAQLQRCRRMTALQVLWLNSTCHSLS